MCLKDAAMDSLASLLIWLLFMWHWRLSLCFHPLGFGSCKTWKESIQYILLLPFGSCLLVNMDPQGHQNSKKSVIFISFHMGIISSFHSNFEYILNLHNLNFLLDSVWKVEMCKYKCNFYSILHICSQCCFAKDQELRGSNS